MGDACSPPQGLGRPCPFIQAARGYAKNSALQAPNVQCPVSKNGTRPLFKSLADFSNLFMAFHGPTGVFPLKPDCLRKELSCGRNNQQIDKPTKLWSLEEPLKLFQYQNKSTFNEPVFALQKAPFASLTFAQTRSPLASAPRRHRFKGPLVSGSVVRSTGTARMMDTLTLDKPSSSLSTGPHSPSAHPIGQTFGPVHSFQHSVSGTSSSLTAGSSSTNGAAVGRSPSPLSHGSGGPVRATPAQDGTGGSRLASISPCSNNVSSGSSSPLNISSIPRKLGQSVSCSSSPHPSSSSGNEMSSRMGHCDGPWTRSGEARGSNASTSAKVSSSAGRSSSSASASASSAPRIRIASSSPSKFEWRERESKGGKAKKKTSFPTALADIFGNNKRRHFQCPEPIVKMRAALAATRPVRELRPHPLHIKFAAIAAVAAMVNVPCGMWREHCAKFSVNWFIAVHATIPFVAMLRKAVIMPKYAILITLAAAIGGQTVGSRVERRRLAAYTGPPQVFVSPQAAAAAAAAAAVAAQTTHSLCQAVAPPRTAAAC